MTDPKKRLRFYNWFFLPMTALLLALTVNLGFKYYQLRAIRTKTAAAHVIKPKPKTEQVAKSYDISSSILLDSILSIVQSYYVDPDRVENTNILAASIASLNAIPGVTAGRDQQVIWVDTGSGRKEFPIRENPEYQEVIDTLALVATEVAKHDAATEGRADIQEASVRVLSSMLSYLDAHSALLSPEAYKELRQGTEGSFGGLGVLVGIRDNLLTVIKPLPRSPAQKAGITRYDRILGIDGKSTYGHTLDELVEYMRGDPGTNVRLSLLRDGASSPAEMQMRREVIQVDSVTSYKVDGPGGAKFLRLAIESFSSRTSREVLSAIKKFRAENGGKMHGLILDLRMNPGGLLDQAVQVADLFLQKGVIVSTKGRREEVESAGSGFDEVGFPMAVLIDSDSASASEIVAGALQDHGRAVIVGQPSFGKGSVQTIFELPGERALKLTIARYYTPSGRSIQNIGIVPDVWLQPVYKGSKNENLLGSFRYKNERFLRNHLESTSSGTNYVTPKYVMKAYYLTDNRVESDFDERKEDLEMDVATDILSRVHKSYGDQVIPGTVRASHWLAIAGPVLKDRTSKLDLATAGWLHDKFGLNWNPVQAADSGSDIQLTIQSPQYQQVLPGDDLKIRYTIKNNSTRPAVRLSVFVRSETAAIDTREYLVGDIPAGGELSGEVSYPIHKAMDEGPAQLRVGVGADAWPSADAIVDHWVNIGAKTYSELEAEVDLVEENGGKIQGVLECRESAKLRVTFYNRGDIALNKVDVSLMNLAGSQIALKDTVKSVSGIGAGESRTVDFPLTGAKVLHTSEIGFGVYADSAGLRMPLKQRFQIRGLPADAISKASNVISH
jgi:carboxyl-terminal processing protease